MIIIKTQLGGQGDPLGRKIKIWPYEEIIYAQSSICPGKWDTQTPLLFWRLSKLLHYWDRSEYWEQSWRLGETCCHSNSSEKPSAGADVKNSQGVNNNNVCSSFSDEVLKSLSFKVFERLPSSSWSNSQRFDRYILFSFGVSCWSRELT